jgi:myo-inositol-1(or 4)-monophosphatase
MRFWRQSPRAWDKGTEGPVSEADLAVNDCLAGLLRAARPGYGWLSEEGPGDPAQPAAPRRFVVDPIDGTRAFLAGERHFALSLAVIADGRPVAGVVHLPALDRLYAAEAAGAATCNGAPIRASGRARPDGATALAAAASLQPGLWPGGVPALTRRFRASLAYRLCLVAEGAFDAMITLRDAWHWDIAAGALIAGRAGAAVTDRDGRPLLFAGGPPQSPGVIAAPPALHAALIAARHPA